MTSQLERLAQPFPPNAIRAPAQGKFGSYVPHHVVVQALLAIVGPYDLHVGEVFKGDDGKIEGCLVTIVAEVDGRRVSVTEIGDCEQPGNWKTQGARMKDAISDGIKRCSARLGLGLHLWAREDYFLYDALHKQSQSENAPATTDGSQGTGGGGDRPDDPGPSALSGTPASASSPAVEAGEHPAAANGGDVSSSPPTSKARRERLKSRCVALQADGVSVADEREKQKLPLVDSCDDEQLTRFELLVAVLEQNLEAPFVLKVDA